MSEIPAHIVCDRCGKETVAPHPDDVFDTKSPGFGWTVLRPVLRETRADRHLCPKCTVQAMDTSPRMRFSDGSKFVTSLPGHSADGTGTVTFVVVGLVPGKRYRGTVVEEQ